jgi:hypothetical protein
MARRSALVAVCAAAVAGFALGGVAHATYYVNVATGADTNTCTQPNSNGHGDGPCKTISAAVAKTHAGDTVRVAAGTYHEAQINITQPIALLGAGADSTVIDGDNATIANTGGLIRLYGLPAGNVTISGFTLEGAGQNNQSGEPFLILTESAPAGSIYTIKNNRFLENTTLDPNLASDFSVGMYSLNSQATFDIANNNFQGMFQAVFFEESNGPVTIHDNTIEKLLASGGFWPEGIFLLADGATNVTQPQVVKNNTLRNYAGMGIGIEAGYADAGQTGTMTDLTIQNNDINLQGATDAASGAAAAIYFKTAPNSSISGVTLNANQIKVGAPSVEMKVSGSGSVSFNEIPADDGNGNDNGDNGNGHNGDNQNGNGGDHGDNTLNS